MQDCELLGKGVRMLLRRICHDHLELGCVLEVDSMCFCGSFASAWATCHATSNTR